MQHEASVGLHGAAEEHRSLFARTDLQGKRQIEPFEKISHRDISGAVDDQPQGTLLCVLAHIDHSIGETTHDLPRHGKKQLPGQADEIVGLLAVNHGSPPGLAVYIDTAYSNVGKFQTSIISKSSLR